MRAAKQRDEWEDLGTCDDIYCKQRHTACSTEVMILMGHVATCPKCQPEEWAEQKAKDGIAR